jgi:4-hydroxybenzoate polyprenyltransferase
MEKIGLIIEDLESPKKPLYYFFGYFFFFLLLRNFWELYSDKACFNWNCFSHFDISFIWLWTAFIILFHIITKVSIPSLTRLVTVGFSIILLPPLVDILLSGGQGMDMTYLVPGYHQDIWFRYFTFWGPLEKGGATVGIRIEVLLVMVGSFYYAKVIKKITGLWPLILALSSYTLIFLFGMAPFFVQGFLEIFGFSMNHHPSLIRNLFLLGIFPNLILLFFFYNRNLFWEVLKDLRYLRMAHYQLIFFLGAALAREQTTIPFLKDHFSPFNWIFLSLSIFFACLFSLITNNIFDVEIDSISNPNRPLASNKVNRSDYLTVAWISLVLSVVFSISVNIQVAFLIMLFIGGYFIYSCYPLRLKRVPFFSKTILGFNSLIIFYTGYYFIIEKVDLALNLIFFFLLGKTLILNFIDIKDFEGDKSQGIKTLPTIFGLENSKKIIGFFFLLVIPCSFFWFNNFLQLPSLIIIPLTLIAALEYYFVTKKNYNEVPIFLTYQIPLIGFLIYLGIK